MNDLKSFLPRRYLNQYFYSKPSNWSSKMRAAIFTAREFCRIKNKVAFCQECSHFECCK
jgi:hypothetical protein